MNRVDMIPDWVQREWKKWFESQGQKPFFTDGKQGKGISSLTKAAQIVGVEINKKRDNRGMLPRPVRALVIGLPNVGKSALINRLVGKKVVSSARRAGVTRQLQWVRISDSIELLDSPGIIPWRLDNQDDAVKLAICEDIGEASYENQHIAAALIDLLVELNFTQILESRYHLTPLKMTGEEYIYNLGVSLYQGDTERATVKLLNDFRKGFMGAIPLEFPPT
jgi:ribosome biogenesis GTPase A